MTNPYANECNEAWCELPDSSGYSVSDHGRVRNDLTGRVLRHAHDKDGYAVVSVHGKTLRVHRLVCRVFHGPAPEGRPIVAHLDGTKTNNTPGNLIWASNWENSQHSVAHGVMPKGEAVSTARLTAEVVTEIWQSPESSRQIAARMGVGYAAINDIRARKTWRHVTAGLAPAAWPKQNTLKSLPRENLFEGSANQAAKRLGVSQNTILRHRRLLLALEGVTA